MVSPFCRNKGFWAKFLHIISLHHILSKNQKSRKKGATKIWFKHMICTPLPFCRKKHFWFKDIICIFWPKNSAMQIINPPPGRFKVMICVALFWVIFLGGPFLDPKRLFCCSVVVLLLLFCCFCCFCCFVVLLLFCYWLLCCFVSLLLFCCLVVVFVVVGPRTPNRKKKN